MAKLQKIFTTFRKRGGLMIVITAALVLELLSGAQYYLTHRLMETQLEKRAESELTLKAILIKGTLNAIEDILKYHSHEIEKNLNDSAATYGVLGEMVQHSEQILGASVCYVPDFFPERGRLYEPYVRRTGDESQPLEREQIGGANHDYTQREFYRKTIETDGPWWADPYLDSEGARGVVTSFTLPVYAEGQGARSKGQGVTNNGQLSTVNCQLAGVVCMDVSLEWLRDTIDKRHIYPSSFVLLLTEGGQPIIRPKESRISPSGVDHIVSLINDSTVARHKSSSGRATIVHFDTEKRDGTIIYANMKGKPHWQLAVVCYDDEVYGPLKQLRLWMLLLMLLAFGILFYVITRYARGEKRLHEKTLEQERIGSELRIATEIQRQMLPHNKDNNSQQDVEVYGSLVPAREVGGDLYDYFVRDEKLFFCIGDVSGKGVPSAMLMAVVHSLFRSASAHQTNPAHIMQTINETSCEGNESMMFVTLFIGVLDLPTGRLRYCNAGHDQPLYGQLDNGQLENGQSNNGQLTISLIDSKPNLPVGVFDDVQYKMYETTLPADSTLFLYTDGLTEARNKEHKMFGMERMKQVLNDKPQAIENAQLLVEQMTEAVHTFAEGAEQSDDLTMLAIRYTPRKEADILSETLTLKNDARQVDRLSNFIKEQTARMELPSKLAGEIRLAVEEAVVNVMEYAYPAGTEGDVTIDVKYDGQRVKIVISDSGYAFDPTVKAEADTTLSAEERPIGGLGILLVRRLMDSINYERVDGKNVLTMWKASN